MNIICPKNSRHQSTDPAYCSECGAKIDVGNAPAKDADTTNISGGVVAHTSEPDSLCPECNMPRLNKKLPVCMICRYDFVKQNGSVEHILESLGSKAASEITVTPAWNLGAGVAPVTDLGSAGVTPVADLDRSRFTPVTDLGSAGVTPVADLDLSVTPASDLGRTGTEYSAAAETDHCRWQTVITVDCSLYTDPAPNVPCPAQNPERQYFLDLNEYFFGRTSATGESSNENRNQHLEIHDPGTSRKHFKLIRENDFLFIQDVGSSNGTYLNGTLLPAGIKAQLQTGDNITLGCWTRIFIRSHS